MSPLTPPSRWPRPTLTVWFLGLLAATVFLNALTSVEIRPERLVHGVHQVGPFLSQAFPPDFSRIGPITFAMGETLQMAVLGVSLGVLFSLPLAFLCASNLNPSPWLRLPVRWLVAIFRTIPDLIWAMLFLVLVGFGPMAGILAIMIDTMGFCSRFFAERVEEVPPGTSEALASCGAGPLTRILGAIVPVVLPSFLATSLYAGEKSIRAAVILGLVGAGGIGIELRSAMNLQQYPQALTIIIIIFAVVITVEHLSSWLREKMKKK